MVRRIQANSVMSQLKELHSLLIPRQQESLLFAFFHSVILLHKEDVFIIQRG
jgi:hypothetical protein